MIFNIQNINRTRSGLVHSVPDMINHIKVSGICDLEKNTDYCRFFGVDSAENVQKELFNQMALTKFKMKEQNLVNFPFPVIDTFNATSKIKSHIDKCIESLKENGFGRWTINSNAFGKKGESGAHTIGLIYEKDKIWILDSLGIKCEKMKQLYLDISELIGNNTVYFSKFQQNQNNYTCNNWTHANLDVIINYKKRFGKDAALSETLLHKILPGNINRILMEQKEYVMSRLNGQNLINMVVDGIFK